MPRVGRKAPSADVRLPVSGVRVQVREPAGEDQLVLLERSSNSLETLVAVLPGLAADANGDAVAWTELPAVDAAAAALLVRRAWLGDIVRTQATCPADRCGELVDISFRVGEYLEHHAPTRRRGIVTRSDGWLGLANSDVSFRIPTLGDLLAAERTGRPAGWLAAQCVQPDTAPVAARARAERALAAIAPRLDDHLTGTCPGCGTAIDLYFDPIRYMLAELRDASEGLYAEVHELALAYHWSEAEIMSLGRRRRQAYVAMLRGEAVLA